MKEIYIALKRLFWLTKIIDNKNKRMFTIALVMLIAISIVLAYIPKIIGDIIDAFNKGDYSINLIIILTLLYLGVEFMNYVKKLCVEKASTDSWNKLVKINIDHLLHIDLSWLKEQELGGLNAKFQRSINGAIKLLKIAFMDLLPSFFLVIFAISMAFYTDLKVGAIITMVVPVAFFIIGRQIKTQKGIRIALNNAIENIQSKLIEMLLGIDTIRASGNEKVQLERIGEYSEEIRDKEFKHHKSMMSFDAFKGLNKIVWNLAVFVIALFAFKNNYITIGQVSTFLLLFANVIKPLDEFHRFLDELSEASIHTGNFIKLMEVPKDKIFNDESKNATVEDTNEVLIKAEGFGFGYKNKVILNDVNFEMKLGMFYGLVGKSGCGKSTLIKTILGFDFGTGKLEYKGIDISTLKRDFLTNKIGYVSQKPFITTGTYRENIVYGLNGGFTDEEIMIAAKKAKIDDKIKMSKNGLDSKINPSGSNISGGEAQRIALTRLFLDSSAELIILDEGTSALDNVTEDLVYKSLFALTEKGKTVISIAHRLDTLRKAEKIFVMDEGTIVESGKYDELSILNGYFKRLLERSIKVENV